LKESLLAFTGTDLYERVRSSEEVRREEPFVFIHDGVLVRGTIDVMFKTAGKYGIIDYKTDKKIESALSRGIFEGYSLQVGIYALALYRANYVIPSQLVLYFLSHGLAREVPCDEGMLDEVSRVLSETITSMVSGSPIKSGIDPRSNPRLNRWGHRSENCTWCPYIALCNEQ